MRFNLRPVAGRQGKALAVEDSAFGQIARYIEQARIVLIAPDAVGLHHERGANEYVVCFRGLYPGKARKHDHENEREACRECPRAACEIELLIAFPRSARNGKNDRKQNEVRDHGGFAIAEKRRYDSG